MNPSPRQLELIEEVRRLQNVTVEALAERFGVTLQTVRRDIRQLTDAGLLTRFHGGVRMPGSTTENIEYRKRQQLNAQAKQRIAQHVARRVPHGSSLLINIGTTTEAIARELLQHKGLRVITNNLNVAAILPDDRVVDGLAGGPVPHQRGLALVGDADGGDVRRRQAGLGERLARGGELRREDLLRIVLHPAGLRIDLAELALRHRDDAASSVEDD